MKATDNTRKYIDLRERYPVFTYESFACQLLQESLEIRFHFHAGDAHHFFPSLSIPSRSFYVDFQSVLNDKAFNNLVFQLGMIELISYWKACCSPLVLIKAGFLQQELIPWWKNLYYNGLGEFFYLNGIPADPDDFMDIRVEATGSDSPTPPPPFANGAIVPIGGGKDSIVTLELLREKMPVRPFLLNPREAMLRCIDIAGIPLSESIVFHRTIDPHLIALNEQGYLNGHTPFSALLAFMCLIASRLSGIADIALSNEASANESSIPGTSVNHQYSKTFDFEQDFRYYAKSSLHLQVNYFSFLRPLLEIQIARLFATFPRFHAAFRSCNAGSKTDSWCGKCPKCLFAWIILSPVLETITLIGIFRANLYEDEGQWENLLQLAGLSAVKPFECVGTINEVRFALAQAIEKQLDKPLPLLLERIKPYLEQDKNTAEASLLDYWNTRHFLPGHYLDILHNEWISYRKS